MRFKFAPVRDLVPKPDWISETLQPYKRGKQYMQMPQNVKTR